MAMDTSGLAAFAGTETELPVSGDGLRGGGAPRGARFPVPFAIAFQPIVDLRRNGIFAQEALLRGSSGEPAEPVLAATGAASSSAFDQVCRLRVLETAARLRLPDAISINFAPNAVPEPRNWLQTTISAARALGIALDRLIFEMTEAEQVRDVRTLARIVAEFRRFGLRTAIDDFGAGFAGLSLLADVQPDILKIDMGLVRGIHDDTARYRIVEGIRRTADNLGILVIAEGVETAEERDALLDLGITLQQGFLFARPVFEGWVGDGALGGLPRQRPLA